MGLLLPQKQSFLIASEKSVVTKVGHYRYLSEFTGCSASKIKGIKKSINNIRGQIIETMGFDYLVNYPSRSFMIRWVGVL